MAVGSALKEGKQAKVSPGDATRNSLLDVAEQLLAEKGLAGMSIRKVTERAKQNLASVSYHFGSKEGLLCAVYLRRADDLNDERRTLLENAVERHGDSALPLDEIIRAILTPPVAWAKEKGTDRAQFMMFLQRSHHDSSPKLRDLRLRKAETLGDIVLPHLRRALPEATADDLYWGVQFALGAMHYAIADRGLVKVGARKAGDVSVADTVDRLVAFVSAGFVAACNCKVSRPSPDDPKRALIFEF